MDWQPGQEDEEGAGPDPRLAAFAQDDSRDAPAPSAPMALLVDELSGPGRRCPGADGDELIGLLRAWAAIESWAAGGKLGMIREIMRHEGPPSPGSDHGDLPETWSRSLRYELAGALACSTQSAEGIASLAWQLGARLPRIGARLEDGTLTGPKARAVAQALSLSPADLAVVNTLGITADYDLRTTAEIAESPDVVPAGATYANLNVMADISLEPTLTSPAAAEQYMEEIEQQFVTNPTAEAAFGTLLTDIANSDGAVLYHCTAGKDRTGWATAVLLTLLGVPQDTVTADYLLSNIYYFDSPAVQAELKEMPAAESAVYAPLLEVQASYLQADFAQVKASYGSMYGYAVRGLGLSPQTIAKLRHKLLVG